MTPWAWHWKALDDEAWAEEYDSRDRAISAARKELGPDKDFEIIEARMSEDKRHYEGDTIPFLRTRNRETIKATTDEHP